MSDAHQEHAHATAHEGPHEGPIKTPKQLIWAVVASFVVPIIVIIMLTQFVATGQKQAAGTEALEAEAVARRIQPVGKVEIKDASDVASLKTGEQVFQAQCSACHATGAAGAPRIKQSLDTLLTAALKGKGNMGAQGGGDFSDFEIARAVVYMTNKAGAKFDEPKAPAAAASAAQ